MKKRFDYDNEVRVIKQSLPVFLTIVSGVTTVLVPFVLGDVNINYIILVTTIIILIDILGAIILHFYGEGKVRRL